MIKQKIMFDFDLMNKALTDKNVSETEFRTLYLIVNNCSMKNTESIEMYNAFLMSVLHYSESTVKRCTKALEQNGYISIKRATKKKTPNIISLMPVLNECKNEVKNDTLYNNTYNNKNNIQSNIQSTINEEDGIDLDVFFEEELAREKAEREQKASYNYSNNLNEDNPNVSDNSNVEIHSNDTEDYNSNEEIKANEQSTKGVERSITPQQQNNPNSIDWDGWRDRFEKCKKGMLNAKCKTDFDLWRGNCKESLNFAKEHMRPEKYDKQKGVFDKWYASSEPFFYFNKQKGHSAVQGQTAKPTKVFDYAQWDSYLCEIQYAPEKREQTAHEMVQYLKDCGKDPKRLIKELKGEYGIVL